LNLKTNPILLQAEFALNTRQILVTHVIDRIRNATGYICERIIKTWHEVEAIIPDQFEGRIGTRYPTGSKEVVSCKNMVTICYDAEAIGTGDLLENGFGFPLSLAPARVHNEATNQIRKTALITLISSVLTVPIMVLCWAPHLPHKIAYAVSLALATIIQGLIAGPIYSGAIHSLFLGQTIDMNLFVVLSITVAYVVSVASFIHDIQGVDKGIGLSFETSALLVTHASHGWTFGHSICLSASHGVSIGQTFATHQGSREGFSAIRIKILSMR
jgi:Cd2+-exporting ATPase